MRIGRLLVSVALIMTAGFARTAVDACCPAPPPGKPVLNADQTVLIVWDAAKKTQHFIRRASFRGEAQDFGFLIPTPTVPELAESGNEVFPILSRITAPEVVRRRRMVSIGCSAAPPSATTAGAVTVLKEQLVAGFQAVVLLADSSESLVEWLRGHGYTYSPQIAAWAEPYLARGWPLTALKVAPGTASGKTLETAHASALRLSFQTEAPLFPYREPDLKGDLETLRPKDRMLRIFFVGEGRFRGDLEGVEWTGRTAWSGPIPGDIRESLNITADLPAGSIPATGWLTEFEDNWPYTLAPSDLTFRPEPDQTPVSREPTIVYYENPLLDLLPCLLLPLLFLVPILFVLRSGRRRSPA